MRFAFFSTRSASTIYLHTHPRQHAPSYKKVSQLDSGVSHTVKEGTHTCSTGCCVTLSCAREPTGVFGDLYRRAVTMAARPHWLRTVRCVAGEATSATTPTHARDCGVANDAPSFGTSDCATPCSCLPHDFEVGPLWRGQATPVVHQTRSPRRVRGWRRGWCSSQTRCVTVTAACSDLVSRPCLWQPPRTGRLGFSAEHSAGLAAGCLGCAPCYHRRTR